MQSPDLSLLFEDHGRVEELELDEDLLRHLAARAFYRKHRVSAGEIAEVHAGSPKYYANAGEGRKAPIIMLGPTNAGRILAVPLEPAGRRGIWRPVTAFEANTGDVKKYKGGA